jgi:MFS family permease/predicted esterase
MTAIRAESPGTHMIVLPGGGYAEHAAHEAEPVARWLSEIGVSASVFRYPLNVRHPAPLDALRAEIARRRAAGAHRIGLIGFSAGGHLAGLAALAPGAPGQTVQFAVLGYAITSMETETYRPARLILLGEDASPRLRRSTSLDALVTPASPPFFVWHTAEDPYVPPEHTYRLAAAWQPAVFPTPCTCSPTARTARAWPRTPGILRSGPRWPAPGSMNRRHHRADSAEGLVVTDHAKPVSDAADDVRPGPGARERPERRTLPRAAAFWILAGLFLILFFASSAASPLYRVYQVRFHFSAATLTAVFAVYVLVLLATLLVFGSVSDYLGRLPVIIAALVVSVAACGVFLAAHGVAALYVARSLQGVASGLASGPTGAVLIDLQPAGSQRAPVVTSVFSTLGLALGALITSALVQYAPAPTQLIWWALLAVFAAGIVAVLAMAEPGLRRPGALASLRPRIAVPRRARGTFAAAVPCIVAGWVLGGLYLSLGPSLAAQVTGSPNLLWGGLVIFLLCGTGAAAAFALRNAGSRATMLAGCLFLLAGMAVTFGAIATTASAAFIVGAAVAGAGFGLAFLGSFRVITALAESDDRAGLVAAFYIVGYLAFSVPALVAGVATTAFGLHSTALVYSGSLAVLAAAAVGILLLRRLGRLPRFCLQLRDLLAGRDDKFVIGIRVTAQPHPPGTASVSSTQVRPASAGSPAASATMLVNWLTTAICLSRSNAPALVSTCTRT